MRFIVALLALVALQTAPSTLQAKAARCEGCTDSQFRQKALSLGEGQHVITSLSTNRVRAYRVIMETEPGSNYGQLFLQAQSVPSDLRYIFDVAVKFYALTKGTMKYGVTVDADDLNLRGLNGATAYDVMLDANLKARLGDRIAQGDLPVSDTLDRAGEIILEGGLSAIGINEDAELLIAIRMEDGSIVVYKIGVLGYTGDYQEGRSRTASGELIPESNSASSQGTWYGPDGLNGLSNYLQRIGATMANSGSGTVIVRIKCSWNGKTLHCVREHRSAF